jgi:rod shape-determining protein MreC
VWLIKLTWLNKVEIKTGDRRVGWTDTAYENSQMKILRDDIFTHRGGLRRNSGVHGVLLFALVFVSIALMVLSRFQHPFIKDVRAHVENFMAPALNVALVPLTPVRRLVSRVTAYTGLYAELDRLKEENQRMKGWEWKARELERKYSQLGKLAHVVDEPGLEHVGARIVADSRGPFARSVMVNLGRDQALKPGFPVISADGLIGRVNETGRGASRILLLTDINSRIPVFIGRNSVRALMVGDNAASPKLTYAANNGGTGGGIEVGDEVSTSGVGGLFPRGLRIGTVADHGGKLVVIPHARLDELDFVSVLLFESPTQELADSERAPGREPRRSVAGRFGTPMVEY